MKPQLLLIDAATEQLHAAGYSYGHHASVNRDGGELRYTVFAHSGEQQIVVHAATLPEAYEAAARQVN